MPPSSIAEDRPDPLTGLWTYATLKATPTPTVDFACVDLEPAIRRRGLDPNGPEAARVIRTVAHRFNAEFAPGRVYRCGWFELAIEISAVLDRRRAIEVARHIGKLVGEPIAGINEPLEARIGIACERVDRRVPAWSWAIDAAHDASARGLPFVVDSGGPLDRGGVFSGRFAQEFARIDQQVATVTPELADHLRDLPLAQPFSWPSVLEPDVRWAYSRIRGNLYDRLWLIAPNSFRADLTAYELVSVALEGVVTAIGGQDVLDAAEIERRKLPWRVLFG